MGKCHGTVLTESAQDFSLPAHVRLKPREIVQCISADQPAAAAPGPYL